MKLFYWNEKPNLGDVLNRLMFPSAEWAPTTMADTVAIGSVLEWFHGFTGTVFGSGRAGPRAPVTDLTRANVLALRGLDTRRLVQTDDECVYGDPALLLGDTIVRHPQMYTAIVPHYTDQERMRTLYTTARFVDVTGNPTKAIQIIADAERVVSSSLHGIVLADAFGVPRMWDWFDGVQAQGFKFRDYGTVVGAFNPGEWHQPTNLPSLRTELRSRLNQLKEKV